MRSKLFLYLVGIVSIAVVFPGHGGQKTEKLQAMHRQIGNNLIKIKKQYPQSQSLVYSLLDQLGKYYAFSKNVIEKKGKYKQLLQTELTQHESLKKEVADMQAKIKKMKRTMVVMHRKLKQDSSRAEQLEKEKAVLAREKEEFLMAKEQFMAERDQLVSERNALLEERKTLIQERDNPDKKGGRGNAKTQVQKKSRETRSPRVLAKSLSPEAPGPSDRVLRSLGVGGSFTRRGLGEGGRDTNGATT